MRTGGKRAVARRRRARPPATRRGRSAAPCVGMPAGALGSTPDRRSRGPSSVPPIGVRSVGRSRRAAPSTWCRRRRRGRERRGPRVGDGLAGRGHADREVAQQRLLDRGAATAAAPRARGRTSAAAGSSSCAANPRVLLARPRRGPGWQRTESVDVDAAGARVRGGLEQDRARGCPRRRARSGSTSSLLDRRRRAPRSRASAACTAGRLAGRLDPQPAGLALGQQDGAGLAGARSNSSLAPVLGDDAQRLGLGRAGAAVQLDRARASRAASNVDLPARSLGRRRVGDPLGRRSRRRWRRRRTRPDGRRRGRWRRPCELDASTDSAPMSWRRGPPSVVALVDVEVLDRRWTSCARRPPAAWSRSSRRGAGRRSARGRGSRRSGSPGRSALRRGRRRWPAPWAARRAAPASARSSRDSGPPTTSGQLVGGDGTRAAAGHLVDLDGLVVGLPTAVDDVAVVARRRGRAPSRGRARSPSGGSMPGDRPAPGAAARCRGCRAP